MKIHDISRPILAGMPVWPGDTPTEFAFSNTKVAGYSANVGRLRLSLHCGTHADAPFHYNDSGQKMDEVPPETYVGPARVVDIRGHATITTALLSAHDFAGTPRVLLKSDTWTDFTVFPREWPLMTPDVPAWLAAKGVKLIGLDVPSVDHIKSHDLQIHHACDAAGVVILENLDLRAITPGVYELIALPLRIQGADGSPIRAVLRSG
jgi:arylformamidase